jgi:hypothetical protein
MDDSAEGTEKENLDHYYAMLAAIPVYLFIRFSTDKQYSLLVSTLQSLQLMIDHHWCDKE